MQGTQGSKNELHIFILFFYFYVCFQIFELIQSMKLLFIKTLEYNNIDISWRE